MPTKWIKTDHKNLIENIRKELKTPNNKLDIKQLTKQTNSLINKLENIRLSETEEGLSDLLDQFLIENNNLKQNIFTVENKIKKLQDGSETEQQILEISKQILNFDNTLEKGIKEIQKAVGAADDYDRSQSECMENKLIIST